MDNKRGEEKCLRKRLNLLLRILLYITKYIIRKFTRDVIVIDHATDSIVPKINTERTTVSKVINDVDTPYINRCFVEFEAWKIDPEVEKIIWKPTEKESISNEGIDWSQLFPNIIMTNSSAAK